MVPSKTKSCGFGNNLCLSGSIGTLVLGPFLGLGPVAILALEIILGICLDLGGCYICFWPVVLMTLVILLTLCCCFNVVVGCCAWWCAVLCCAVLCYFVLCCAVLR